MHNGCYQRKFSSIKQKKKREISDQRCGAGSAGRCTSICRLYVWLKKLSRFCPGPSKISSYIIATHHPTRGKAPAFSVSLVLGTAGSQSWLERLPVWARRTGNISWNLYISVLNVSFEGCGNTCGTCTKRHQRPVLDFSIFSRNWRDRDCFGEVKSSKN